MKKNTIKRSAAIVSAFTTLLTLPAVSVLANVNASDSGEMFPYTMFASSQADGAVTVNAKHFCMNGNIASNGTVVTNGRANINGTTTENAEKDMVFIGNTLNEMYFSDAVEYDSLDISQPNINVRVAMDVIGDATLDGNVNITSSVKADEDIVITGNVNNTSNAVIYSEFGDVIIDSNNVNLSGMIYAPLGNVEITANNINLNNVVIIADTITLNSNNVNANYGRNYAAVAGSASETKASYIQKLNSYLMDKEAENILDMISEYYTVTPVDAGDFSTIGIQAPLAPGFVVSMDFDIEQYEVEGYGNLSIMKTDGIQQMSTIVLTPFDKDLPLISTDYMFNGENRISYIEFYGLGIDGDENMPVFDSLVPLKDKYSALADTAPSPGWFDEVRTMGLFKVTDYTVDDAVENMLYDSFRATLDASMVAPDLEGEQKAAKFDLVQGYVDNLISNPGVSTAIFNMCLGADTTRQFFYDVFFGTSKHQIEN